MMGYGGQGASISKKHKAGSLALRLTFSGATPTRELLFLLEGFSFNVLFMDLSGQAEGKKEHVVRWARD